MLIQKQDKNFASVTIFPYFMSSATTIPKAALDFFFFFGGVGGWWGGGGALNKPNSIQTSTQYSNYHSGRGTK